MATKMEPDTGEETRGHKKAEGSKIINGNARTRIPSRSKSQLQDDSIMGTNNSSIVSKRSVERLYFPNEPHFFRYFVKKPQRRSPLINRGYWLRMKAIDEVVKQFLDQKSEKKKVVINLGCGYDPLPWQCFTRYPASCHETTFVDVDYRDLMLRKRDVVQGNPELHSMLSNIDVSDGEVLFRSEQYLQIGCDLRDLPALDAILASAVDIENCLVLLTAEVSITYMDVQSADALIQWASKLPEARFCLLEQLLPNGIDHPFAKTMMAHFDKLQTPINAVQRYSTCIAQQQRFESLGWSKVAVRNLWELWSASEFLTSAERRVLEKIEPFDEWEEFALFGCHYFLLVADTGGSNVASPHFLANQGIEARTSTTINDGNYTDLQATFTQYPKLQGRRRFAAAMPLTGPDRSILRFGVFGGMGLVTRMNSYDEYTSDSIETQQTRGPLINPCSRMGHTITDIGNVGALLVGGRTSPDNALKDCWLYHKWLNTWEPVDDLLYPLYRHQATRVDSECVLVSTGKLDSQTISSSFLLWSRCNGWVECQVGEGDRPCQTYGSVFSSFVNNGNHMQHGIIAGGMSEDAELQQEIWHWEVEGITSKNPMITFKRAAYSEHQYLLLRFGAESINWNGQIFVIGGVPKYQMLQPDKDICAVKIHQGSLSISLVRLQSSSHIPRSLLIGSSSIVAENTLAISGGSCVCFSFGSWWNEGCLTLSSTSMQRLKSIDRKDLTWHFSHTVNTEIAGKASKPISSTPRSLVSVPRTTVSSRADFERILNSSKPMILEKLDIGACSSRWTTEYLQDKVGQDREFVVHEATASHMDFKAKNFSYKTKKFGEFLQEIESGQRLYLRSLSSDSPAELPTNLATDFESIAADFQLPPELAFVTENTHSSPLRISGPVNMWLHYDVMANVLCQVRGSKRMLLFPPSDARYLEFEPASSSSSINAFQMLQDEQLGGVSPHEALLEPGDVLFLPPLWLHTASPTSTVSISVNVFFRNLTNAYAAGKDTYGNRDIKAYEKGRLDIAKIIKSFDGLPADMREFYLQRLADEFLQKIT